MAALNIDRIIEAVGDDGFDAGVSIRTELEPLGGPGAKVKPATYAGGVFQLGRRWWGEGDARAAVDVITIDNEPSEANHLEAALQRNRGELGLPEIILDLSGLEPLPPHVPRQLSSFQFPHRSADAYLRDAELGELDFLKTAQGKAIFSATGERADALMEWFPQALLFGFWQSHLGKKGSQAKLARSWVSEIIGIEPAADDIHTQGLKGDPLNLSIDDKVDFDPLWHERWQLGQKGKKLSDIGHGQVPVGGDEAALSGVSFRAITQQSTVSFASLRRIHTSVAAPEARALLAALGIVAHVSAFGRSFNLRSGCDLRPAKTTWTWLSDSADETIDTPSLTDATALFEAAVSKAESAGLPVGSRWPAPLTVHPKAKLAEVIRKTFPDPESD